MPTPRGHSARHIAASSNSESYINMSDNTSDNAAPYTGPDHGLGDDNALANEIASFDHLGDTKGAAAESRQVLRKSNFTPTVSALAPAMRPAINEKLAGLTGEARAKREGELVLTAMQNLALDARVRQGPGVGANAYQVEIFQQANQLRQLDQEQTRIMNQLAEFDGFKTGALDPATGQPTAEKIHRYQGDRRRALELRLGEIAKEAAHLDGAEGDARLKKALERAVTDTKKSRDQYAIMQEAKVRAAHNAREDQINTLAHAFAKGHRNNLG